MSIRTRVDRLERTVPAAAVIDAGCDTCRDWREALTVSDLMLGATQLRNADPWPWPGINGEDRCPDCGRVPPSHDGLSIVELLRTCR